MKRIVPKINFNKKDFIKILIKCVSCKRLIFIMFFGALLIFTFNILYKYAFLNIEYIDYDYIEDDNFVITDGKISNTNLSRVLRNMDENEKKIRMGINKKYETPFSFKGFELLDEFDYEIRYDNEIPDKNEDENLSDDNENNESNDAVFFES